MRYRRSHLIMAALLALIVLIGAAAWLIGG